MTADPYSIATSHGRSNGCRAVFLGHCSAAFDATDTITACEGGLFIDPEGNDLAAVNILGRWLDANHVGCAFAWTDQHGGPVPADIAERIGAACGHNTVGSRAAQVGGVTKAARPPTA